MSAISTTGARIDRWDNGRPAHREQARLIEALKLERSSRYLYWAAFITFISEPHDDIPDLILAPYTVVSFDCIGGSWPLDSPGDGAAVCNKTWHELETPVLRSGGPH